MKIVETDIVIIGAGPAGSAASLFLAKKNIPHVIFDKALFPRDKVCGDGLSGKVVGLLNELDENIVEEFTKEKDTFLDSWGVRFIAPNGKGIDIPFSKDGRQTAQPPGFVARRLDFDNALLKRLDPKYAQVHLGWEAKKIEYNSGFVKIILENKQDRMECRAKVVVSAEGDRSLVARHLAGYRLQPAHYFAGLRAYYENVAELHPQNFIELHFIPEALPGYFWIFPMSNNRANIGLGILSKDIRNKKLNLRSIFFKALQNNPELQRRFKNAKMIQGQKGWGLPLGSAKRKRSGERFLLTGDAGSLIDPFTGEGVGNALLSGKLAAETLQQALEQDDFSAEFLARYDRALNEEMMGEINLSHRIQRLVRFPWLFNFVVNRISQSPAWQETFSSMFNDLDMRAKLRSPAFYFRLLMQR